MMRKIKMMIIVKIMILTKRLIYLIARKKARKSHMYHHFNIQNENLRQIKSQIDRNFRKERHQMA